MFLRCYYAGGGQGVVSLEKGLVVILRRLIEYSICTGAWDRTKKSGLGHTALAASRRRATELYGVARVLGINGHFRCSSILQVWLLSVRCTSVHLKPLDSH
jgi:hypothetical protein